MGTMIRFFLLQNRAGKTRLSKWYAPFDEDERRKIEGEVHRAVTSREARLCNFIEYRSYKVIYRRYAGLFFTICCDTTDNELMRGKLRFSQVPRMKSPAANAQPGRSVI